MQDAMIAPATSAPAEAPIRMDEIGWVDPRIAPNRPATTARAEKKVYCEVSYRL